MMHQDPRKALSEAQNLVEGKGVLGFLTKLFLGKGAAQQMSGGIAQARAHLDQVDVAAQLRATGLPTQARVLGIADTGALLNFDPVVQLQLEVIPPRGGANYLTELRSVVSKIAVPRVGDVLPVVVDAANPHALALAHPVR